ncbi:MAG: D-tyrosyl-tRNA(Tyr) deacylase [Phycisphaerales bacterium]|nr:D-tyrosyl-tRNA(Tyr) deacylase [Phycisphaerales bacterium]
MIAVVQRVAHAKVTVGTETVGAIDGGLLVLLGVAKGDDATAVEWMARKIAALRIFEDQQGKMNLDVRQIGGSILLVSQFTLLGDTNRGNRPGFAGAEEPSLAATRCDEVANAIAAQGVPVSQGRFGQSMRVELLNDGPVTIVLDSLRNSAPVGQSGSE